MEEQKIRLDNLTASKNSGSRKNNGFLNVLKRTSIVDTDFTKPATAFDKVVKN